MYGTLSHSLFEDEEKLPNGYVVRPYLKTIEQWMEDMKISTPQREQLMAADVIALPVGYKDGEDAFAIGAYDFMAFMKEQGQLQIMACCADGQYTVLELCSSKIRLGRYFLPATVSGLIFWGLLTNYISSQINPILPQITATEVVEAPKFLEAPEVSFSIVIPDSLGNKKEIEYSGPVEGIEKVGEIIKTLTNGDGTEKVEGKSEN